MVVSVLIQGNGETSDGVFAATLTFVKGTRPTHSACAHMLRSLMQILACQAECSCGARRFASDRDK